MGFFSNLFGGSEGGFVEGCQALSKGEWRDAVGALNNAVTAAPQDPLPLAYRSLAKRQIDKSGALADARAAVALDAGCGEAHNALALALLTGDASFEEGFMAFAEAKELAPRDSVGAVLHIGVFLLFVDVLTSAKEDESGVHFNFKSTPLRNAADWLLGAEYLAAFKGFTAVFKEGREIPGALGIVAAAYRLGEGDAVLQAADLLLADEDALATESLGAAVRLLAGR
jgi:hypothetical protein